MKVREIMTTDVRTCRPEDTLEVAAKLMWDRDCGCLPVLGRDDRVQAMITDRDVCMAAWSQGLPLRELRVADTMSRRIVTCRPDDDLAKAAAQMRSNEIRRLPVVDAAGKLHGLLALNDLALTARPGCEQGLGDEAGAQALGVLAAVCRHRGAEPAARTGQAPRAIEMRPQAPPPAKQPEAKKPAASASAPAPPAAKPAATAPPPAKKPAAKRKPKPKA